jgi:hypothetical protein
MSELVATLNTIDALRRMWTRGETPWLDVLEQIVALGAWNVDATGFMLADARFTWKD